MQRKSRLLTGFIPAVSLLALAACGGDNESEENTSGENSAEENSTEEQNGEDEEAGAEGGEVNLYTSRHYDTDEELYEQFTDETGIEVNVVSGEADELIERMEREGEATEGDVFITADAGRLHRAKEADLLQSTESEVLDENIPENYRDADSEWFGLTKRARVLVYDPERVDESELSTYEALTEEKWEDRVLIRSSENIYNQSLMASFIEMKGEEEAKAWAEGIVDNMARDPQGGDRDQALGVASGEGDVAVMNSYYFGQMVNSSEQEEVDAAESLEVFFPNQEEDGTHVNVSGAGITEHGPNSEEAVEFVEFLSSEEAQGDFSEANYEYPVNPDVEPSELLQSWGDFEEQDIDLTTLGENNARAQMLMNEAGWE
ncbi:iron(III) transport system substrate-binding protein [Marinococcus luteus]|uniref:Iron(III) transport system substrate-binding protein n=1 Tax=Marinococcus luteus TaxID=1122204 RepID=A0A1H2RNK7_9BACI|nr:Fe(3+) ABC transporter substrate-binding protein [Marinococcus luteus]SDW20199.1 iron(III) transport system substrate-binding protein [Marinococcus luteus]